MSSRFWILAVLSLALILAFWTTAGSQRIASLRSEHSEPAAIMPAGQVAVVSDGKQFHDPKCKYLHGTPKMMTAEQATRLGYTPDPRCMQAALASN